MALALKCINCTQSTYPKDLYLVPGTTYNLDTDISLPYYQQPSYQNDDYAVEMCKESQEPVPYLSTSYVFLRKHRLISGLASFSVLLPFMLHIHDICSNPKMQLPLFLMGALISLPMMTEVALTIVGATDICDRQCSTQKCRPLISAIKTILTLFIAGLQVTRLAAALIPDQPYESVAEELCTWKGDNLFTSIKWTALVFVPTVLLIIAAIVEILIGYLFPDFPSEHQRK